MHMKKYISRDYEVAECVAMYHSNNLKYFRLEYPKIFENAIKSWTDHKDTLNSMNFFEDKQIDGAFEHLQSEGIDDSALDSLLFRVFSQYVFDTAFSSAFMASLKQENLENSNTYQLLRACNEFSHIRREITKDIIEGVKSDINDNNIEAAILRRLPAESYRSMINGSVPVAETLERIKAIFFSKLEETEKYLSSMREFSIIYIVESHYDNTIIQNFSSYMTSKIYGEAFEPVTIVDDTMNRVKMARYNTPIADLQKIRPIIEQARDVLKGCVDYESLSKVIKDEYEETEQLMSRFRMIRAR